MKRSEINAVMRNAAMTFKRHGWTLPPNPKWDVTDFGLGDFAKYGLILINLTEQPEYCEKIMYVGKHQVTPRHYHKSKKEDIICRWGELAIELPSKKKRFKLQVNGELREIPTDRLLILNSGERITLTPKTPHSFWAESDYAIVGEISTANDDKCDNFFEDSRVGRFAHVDEDEPAIAELASD
jgi:D-lyxose ketol-isomerase